MKTKEEILNKHMGNEVLHSYQYDAIIEAMEEYAAQNQPNGSNMVLAVSGPSPYSIMDILPRLVRATEILLYRKDYDGPDYEEMMQAVKYSKQITFRAACATAKGEERKE